MNVLPCEYGDHFGLATSSVSWISKGNARDMNLPGFQVDEEENG
jgi:hypothetical protein